MKNYRLKYSPDLCEQHYVAYSTKEIAYICQWYGQISSREIALSLGRTQGAILKKVYTLKQTGQFEHFKKLYKKLQ